MEIKKEMKNKKENEDKKRAININNNRRFKWSGFAPYKFRYYKM